MALSETDIAAALARLDTQIEHLQISQDRNTEAVARLTQLLSDVALHRRGQKAFITGIAATVSLLWSAGFAIFGLLRTHF